MLFLINQKVFPRNDEDLELITNDNFPTLRRRCEISLWGIDTLKKYHKNNMDIMGIFSGIYYTFLVVKPDIIYILDNSYYMVQPTTIHFPELNDPIVLIKEITDDACDAYTYLFLLVSLEGKVYFLHLERNFDGESPKISQLVGVEVKENIVQINKHPHDTILISASNTNYSLRYNWSRKAYEGVTIDTVHSEDVLKINFTKQIISSLLSEYDKNTKSQSYIMLDDDCAVYRAFYGINNELKSTEKIFDQVPIVAISYWGKKILALDCDDMLYYIRNNELLQLFCCPGIILPNTPIDYRSKNRIKSARKK